MAVNIWIIREKNAQFLHVGAYVEALDPAAVRAELLPDISASRRPQELFITTDQSH